MASAVAAALATAALGFSALPAGASTAARNTRFCKVLQSQHQTDLQGLNPDSAVFAIKQIDKLLKTNPPSAVKKALKKIGKVYKQIGNGAKPAEVVGSAIGAFTTYSNYVAANCRTTTSTT